MAMQVYKIAIVDETDIGHEVFHAMSSMVPLTLKDLMAIDEVIVQAILNSFILVFISEMGDKTQLLALLLTARYKKPGVILAGVFVATLINHALAAWVGLWASAFFTAQTLKWILAISFFVFAAWILVPDKEGDIKESSGFGVFFTTLISFFLAEMGDKTQLATIALGATYANTLFVTLGTTIGMLASNALAIFLGDRLLKKIPIRWVRFSASLLFIVFGAGILIEF
jgi:Ca2+/H+ antiporter, TMEM165/GDT1 family